MIKIFGLKNYRSAAIKTTADRVNIQQCFGGALFPVKRER